MRTWQEYANENVLRQIRTEYAKKHFLFDSRWALSSPCELQIFTKLSYTPEKPKGASVQKLLLLLS